MIEFTCEFLFEESLRDRILLIVTDCGKYLTDDECEAQQNWLDKEMSVGSSLFPMCFSLVNFDPARVLFLNNMNEEVETSAVSLRICKKNNIEMARKVIKVVHETMNKEPISISSVVSQAIRTKLKIEERLRNEED